MSPFPFETETFWKLFFCLDELEHPLFVDEDRDALLVREAGRHSCNVLLLAPKITQALLVDLANMFTACRNTTLARLRHEKTPTEAANCLKCAMLEALDERPTCRFEAASHTFQFQDRTIRDLLVRQFAGFLAMEVFRVACYPIGSSSVECIQFSPFSWRNRIRRSLLMSRVHRLYGAAEDPKLKAHILVGQSLCEQVCWRVLMCVICTFCCGLIF